MGTTNEDVEKFLKWSKGLSDRLDLWFERDRPLHIFELIDLLALNRWQYSDQIFFEQIEKVIVGADKANGTVSPIAEFAVGESGELLIARTAHNVASQVATQIRIAINKRFHSEGLQPYFTDGQIVDWMSGRTALINDWHRIITSDLPGDEAPKLLLKRMVRERLIVEAWRDQLSLKARAKENAPPEPDGPFISDGTGYFRAAEKISEKLIATELALVKAIWNAPDRTISIEDAGDAIRGESNHKGISYKAVAGYRDRINRKLNGLPFKMRLNKKPQEHMFFEKILD